MGTFRIASSVFLCIFFANSTLPAQNLQPNTPRVFDITWDSYSYSHQGRLGLHGGGLEFATHISRDWALVFDVGAHRSLGNLYANIVTFRAGPRITMPVKKRFTAFSQVLIGVANVTPVLALGGATLTGDSFTGSSVAIGSGIDFAVNHWLSLRPFSGEFVANHFAGNQPTNTPGSYSIGSRFGGGLIFKFGRVPD